MRVIIWWTCLPQLFPAAAGNNGISKGGLKPEVVLSPGVQPQASTDAPQTTDLVPQTYTGLLPPHYEASAERRPSNFSYQNDHETVEDPIEVIDLGSSSMQHDRSKSDQGLPRTLDVAKVSEVCGWTGQCLFCLLYHAWNATLQHTNNIVRHLFSLFLLLFSC